MAIMNNVVFISTISLFVVGIISIMSIGFAEEEENATDSEEPKFLAIQHAQSGSIPEINETAYTLQLNDVSDKTILFSDRPDRIVTSVSTSDFIGNWTTEQDSFTKDAPNAVLVIDEIAGQQDTAIIELFNPVYDVDKKTLKYDITPDNATSIDLPNEFGQSTLVIDNHCSPLDPRC